MSIKEKADYLRERGKASPALKIAKTAFDHASKIRLKHTPKHQILELITKNIEKIGLCADSEQNIAEALEVCYQAYESVQTRLYPTENEAGGNAGGNAKQTKGGYKPTLRVHTLGNENSFYGNPKGDIEEE